MRRTMVSIGLLLILTLFLTACSAGGGDELYALPKLSSDNEQLQAKLDQIIAAGGELSAPQSGSNVQSVQQHDLNGDGEQEAVAFFRFVNDEKPLKIYLLSCGENGQYEEIGLIEGEGTAFYSVLYENVVGSEQKELVVTWQLASSTSTRLLTVHAFDATGATELMRTHYANYQALDIDRDGLMELVVIQLDGENSRAELYHADGSVMQLGANAPLSASISSVRQVRAARLREYDSAVFVYSLMEDGNYVTDIFAWQDHAFMNITYDEAASMSVSTIGSLENAAMTDINADGIIEIPFAYQMPKANQPGASEMTYWGIHWRQFDIYGKQYATVSTYHNSADGWYLVLPEAWATQVQLTRDESTNVRTDTFSYIPAQGEEAQAFLRIHRYTGSTQSRATTGNRFKLLETAKETYAAEFLEVNWDCGLDEESLRAAFHLIQAEWQ